MSGSETLIDKIYQIQADVFHWMKKEYHQKYYSYINNNNTLNDLDFYKKNCKTLRQTFSKLIESTKDRFLIIPLSGGLTLG